MTFECDDCGVACWVWVSDPWDAPLCSCCHREMIPNEEVA